MSTIRYQESAPEQIARAARFLSMTGDAVAESTEGLSAAQWEFKPSSDRWSIAEILEHLVLVEGRIHSIVGAICDAPEPPPGWKQTQVDAFVLSQVANRDTKIMAPPWIYPTGRWSGTEALGQFLVNRRQTIQLLSSAPLRGHVVSHPIFGPWDGYQWLVAAGAHSARHTEQIAEVKADFNFPQESSIAAAMLLD